MDPDDKKSIWSEKQTRMLIEKFKEYSEDLARKKIKSKREIFDMICWDLKEEGADFTTHQCANRWKNLLQKFKKCVGPGKNPINIGSGAYRYVAPFYDDLLEIVKNPILGYSGYLPNDTEDEENLQNSSENDECSEDEKTMETPNNFEMEIVEEDVLNDELFVETSNDDFINLKEMNQAQKLSSLRAAATPSTSNTGKKKVISTSPPHQQIKKTAKVTTSTNTEELTRILRKFTAEMIRHSQRKSLAQRTKIQLMAERNRLLRSIKLSLDSQSQQSSSDNVTQALNKNSNSRKVSQNLTSTRQQNDNNDFMGTITEESTKDEINQWLSYHNLDSYCTAFQHFSGSDILKMSKDDMREICGAADGIRMYNLLHVRSITPNQIIYVSLDGSAYNAIHLITNTVKEFTQKLFKLPEFYDLFADSNVQHNSTNSLSDLELTLCIAAPNGMHIVVNDDVLSDIKNNSFFVIEFDDKGKVLLKNPFDDSELLYTKC